MMNDGLPEVLPGRGVRSIVPASADFPARPIYALPEEVAATVERRVEVPLDADHTGAEGEPVFPQVFVRVENVLFDETTDADNEALWMPVTEERADLTDDAGLVIEVTGSVETNPEDAEEKAIRVTVTSAELRNTPVTTMLKATAVLVENTDPESPGYGHMDSIAWDGLSVTAGVYSFRVNAVVDGFVMPLLGAPDLATQENFQNDPAGFSYDEGQPPLRLTPVTGWPGLSVSFNEPFLWIGGLSGEEELNLPVDFDGL
jgi:hypothetical protein